MVRLTKHRALRNAQQMGCFCFYWKAGEDTSPLFWYFLHLVGYVIPAMWGHPSFWIGSKAGTPPLYLKASCSLLRTMETGYINTVHDPGSGENKC